MTAAVHPDLIDDGPCPRCGRQRWRLRLCTCGHRCTAHKFNTARTARTACCGFTDGSGEPCTCTKMTEEVAS
jgi:hypothetical protein